MAVRLVSVEHRYLEQYPSPNSLECIALKHRKVLYAGSFDPVTLGHMDIIERAVYLFDEVVVGVAVNIRKRPLLPTETRVKLLKEATSNLTNVSIVAYQGMTIEYAHKIGANVLLRGVRNPTDFHSEFQMAITNTTLAPDLETIFFASAPAYTFINSCLVREVAASGGDITPFVPKNVVDILKEILHHQLTSKK